MLETPKTVDAEPKSLAVMVSLTAQLSQQRSIVMQTYMPQDAALVEYNKVVDKLSAAIDHQEWQQDILELEASLVTHQATLKQLEADFANIEPAAEAAFKLRGKRGEFKLSDSERAQKGVAEQNIKRYRTEIDKIKAQLLDARAKIAKET